MNFSSYNLDKLKKINESYVLNVNADEMMKSKHIKEACKSKVNCCFINLISHIK